jgi:hypothetical protein
MTAGHGRLRHSGTPQGGGGGLPCCGADPIEARSVAVAKLVAGAAVKRAVALGVAGPFLDAATLVVVTSGCGRGTAVRARLPALFAVSRRRHP